MTNRITGRRIGLACGVLFCFFVWYLGILKPDADVSQFKINSDMDIINDKLRTELSEVQNKTVEIAEAAKTVKERQQNIEQLNIQGRIAEETELIKFEGGASDGLRKLWQENDLPKEDAPDYYYFANAGEGHYRPWRENEVAFAVKKYAGMAGMENEAWELKRVNYVDGLYHAYAESETGNELYILLSEDAGLETFIIAADIRKNGEADVLLQDERYSYNSALTWYSYEDWFYGEKTHEGTISFERKGEFLDHMYADGCSYAVCDYLERIRGSWDSEWTIEENLMYVGTNGYIADAYCTDGEKELSLLIDVWNHCYAVLE